MIHLKRYFAALFVLFALCGTYALAVAPWLEPPPLVRPAIPEDSNPTPPISGGVAEELERLFPPDAWQRKNPKVVETEQCTLLIQDYKRLPDGGLELKPCTLIFHSSSPAGPGANEPNARGRPIVLDAPLAKLSFDRPLDLARASFGRVEKGTLEGEINIYSPPTVPGGRDELRVHTRTVFLDRQSIRTSSEVEFQYGESSGRGREMEITLQEQAGKSRQEKAKLGGIQTLTLRHLHHLYIAAQGHGILGDAIPSKQAAAPSVPLEITCQAEFTFDVPAQLARFLERVEVRRLIPGAPPDVLRCDELLLALAPRKASAADSPDDPLAGRLSRIIAIGSPAVLEAPSRGVQAVAAFMEYSLADRFVTLKSDKQKNLPQVSLRQPGQHFIAPELHYQMAEQGRLGRLRAPGPGELRMLQGSGRGQQIVTARWERELQIQPQERNHVISLVESASVTIDPLGRFDGNELHLWVLEVESRPAVPAGQEQQIGGAMPDASAAAAGESKTTIIPDRLLAVGKVRVVSMQLDVDTSRLEAWFLNLPSDGAQKEPIAPPGPIREPTLVQPVAYTPTAPPQATIQNVIRPPNLQKFHVGGGMIQMQLVVRGRQFEIEDLNIRGQAEIDETRTPEPGQQPIRLRGDLLEVRRGTHPDATVKVTGQPAEVAGRGMSLAGGQIQAHRGENRLWIDGPGEATLPAGAGVRSQESGVTEQGVLPNMAGDKMHIVWQQGLMFDGQLARFDGDVNIRTATQTAITPVLEAALSRRIDFQAMGGQPQADLASVFLDGGTTGIYVEGRTFDEYGEPLTREQMRARNLLIDRLRNRLHADGPGFVSTVRRGGVGPSATTAPQPSPPQAGAPPSLTSVHVAFEKEIEGDLAQRSIEFRQQVLTTYSPARDFSEVIAADPLKELPLGMVLMKSEKLRITEKPSQTGRAFEMRATERTQIETEQYFVDSPIVSYDSDKATLQIEGDGRAKARISSKLQRNSSEGDRFRYNLRTGELEADNVSRLLIELPPNMKLPVPSGLGPTRPKR